MSKLRIKDAPILPDVDGSEKIPTGGKGDYSITLDQVKNFARGGLPQQLEDHINDSTNPHQVTKGQIGLGNVDNTADLDKPVSNSTQSAIISAVAQKSDKTYVDNQLTLKANKADVYTKVETYTKQESSDLVDNSISTALTPVNSSLELTKRGIANRYDPLLTYNSGERVVLTNGDIVKSTIDGNTNDPNVDVTGWFNTKQSYIGEKSVSLWADSLNIAVSYFDAVDVDKDEVVTTPISVTTGKSIHSNGHTVTQSTPEEPVFETVSGSTDIVYNGVNVTQDKSTPIAGGTSNNHAMFKFHGGKFNAVLNAILDGQYGISFGYGAAQSDPLANRSTRNNLVAFVKAKLLQGMFIENIGAESTRIVGVCLDSSQKLVFHAIRLSGYNKEKNPSESTHAPCRGIVGSAITIRNATNVISYQNSSELTNLESVYVDGADRVVHSTPGTVVANNPLLHRLAFTARNILKAIANISISHSKFGFAIDAKSVTSVAVEEQTGTSSLGFNHYEGVIKDSAQGGAQFRYSHNLYNLQVSGSAFTGVIVGGNYGGGTLITDRNSVGVSIPGSNNNLQIVSTNASTSSISINGNGNVLHIVTDGNVVIGGSGNIITGRIGGKLTGTGSGNKLVGEVVGEVGLSGATNDLKQLKGFSGVEQQSVTTDAAGTATIALSNRNSAALVRHCSVEILNNTSDLRAVIKSISGADVAIKLISKSGADITAETTVTAMVSWSN